MAYYFALGPWYSRGDQDAVQKETYELLKNNKEKVPVNVWVYLVDLGKPVTVIVWEEYRMNEINAMGGPYKIFRNWVTDSGGQNFDDANLVRLEPNPLELPGNHHLEMLLGFRGVIDKFWASCNTR